MSFSIQFLARVYLVAMVACLCSCRPNFARNRVRRQVDFANPTTQSTSTTVTTTVTTPAGSSSTSTTPKTSDDDDVNVVEPVSSSVSSTSSSTTVSTMPVQAEQTTSTMTTSTEEMTSVRSADTTSAAKMTSDTITTSAAAQPGDVYRLSVRGLAIGEEEEKDAKMDDYGKCPPHFIQVDDKSCYYPMSSLLSWKEAENACRYLHSDASLVAINCQQEQSAVLAVSSLLDSDECPMFWTAGQRANLDHDTLPAVPLVWKLRPYVWQTMFHYTNWAMSGPSTSGDCVHVASAGQHGRLTAGTWDTSTCDKPLCVICELPINTAAH